MCWLHCETYVIPSRRTNEIGIRMAIGAGSREVISVVMREALTLVVAGTVVGVAGALAMYPFTRSMLLGLTFYDSTVLSAAVAVMILFATLAAYLPARRASRVSPLIALSHG
jgi:ABC-type antimicrobial peptide transport system permease subunit